TTRYSSDKSGYIPIGIHVRVGSPRSARDYRKIAECCVLNLQSSPMSAINHQFRLVARPVGLPKRSDWNYTEEPVRDPGPGEVLVKILYISLDPAMRGWMNEARSYIEPVKIGDVMRAGTLGRIIASQNTNFKTGDYVVGMLGVQEYAMTDGKGLIKV